MEIFYCRKCKGRVSSVDVQEGRGVEYEGDIFCEACAKEQGIYEEAASQKKSPSSTAQKRGGRGSRTAAAGDRSSPLERTRHVRKSRPQRTARSSNIFANPAVIGGLVLIFLLLAVIGIIFFLRSKGRQQEDGEPPEQKTGMEEKPLEEETAPDKKMPKETPKEREHLQELSEREEPEKNALDERGPEKKTPVHPVKKEPEKKEQSREVVWGEAMELNYFEDSKRWSTAGGKPEKQGNGMMLQGGGLDVMYQCNSKHFILEADVKFSTEGRSWRDSLHFHYPRRSATRGEPLYLLAIMSDRGVQLFYKADNKKLDQGNANFKKGEYFHLKLVVKGAQTECFINGTKVVSGKGTDYPYAGGIQFSTNRRTEGFKIFVKNITITLPDSSGG